MADGCRSSPTNVRLLFSTPANLAFGLIGTRQIEVYVRDYLTISCQVFRQGAPRLPRMPWHMRRCPLARKLSLTYNSSHSRSLILQRSSSKNRQLQP